MHDPIALYDSGQVLRWHANTQMNRRMQTNADHQWGVLAILTAMLGVDGLTKGLMLHAAFHDVGERLVGDLPMTTKHAPELAEFKAKFDVMEGVAASRILGFELPALEQWEAIFLKAADRIEAMLAILLYAPNPSQIDGWDMAVDKTSELCGQDRTGKIYQFLLDVVQPLINRHDKMRHFTFTPF